MDDPYNDVWLPALVIELALPDGGALLLLDNNALLVRNGVDGGGDNGVALGAVLGPALLLDLGVVDGLDNSLVNGPALALGYVVAFRLVLGLLNRDALWLGNLNYKKWSFLSSLVHNNNNQINFFL